LSKRQPYKSFLRAAFCLCAALLSSFAFSPLIGEGFFGADLPLLAGVSEALWQARADGDPSFFLKPFLRPPLEWWSLLLSARSFAREGVWTLTSAAAMRAENLALLWIASLALAAFVRRCLEPWTGEEQARAAGLCSGILLSVHPLLAGSIAQASSRGGLIALALVLSACACFLRGRQEGSAGWTLASGILCLLAPLAHEGALFAPALLVGAEFFSAHRHRRKGIVLRTSATTLAVFGACAGLGRLLEEAVAVGMDGASGYGFGAPASLETIGSLGILAEKLGLLCLPVNASALGPPGFALAGLLLLIAIQPALLAARAAPRQWSVLLSVWIGSICAVLLFSPGQRVHPRDFTAVGALLGAAVPMAAGLGVASTAVRGVRRLCLPWILCLGYAFLGHGNALSFARAIRSTRQLEVDLYAATLRFGTSAHYFVLDPPGLVAGVDALGGALPWMLHPSFTLDLSGTADLSDTIDPAAMPRLSEERSFGAPSREQPWLRGGSYAAFAAWTREREFDELRRGGLVVLLPPSFESWHFALAPENGKDARQAIRLPEPEPSRGRRVWYRQGRSPALDLEALAARALRVRVSEFENVRENPRAGWRASEPLLREGSAEGVWLRRGGEILGVFDLSRAPGWLLGGRIRLIWPQSGWNEIVEAEVLDELPPIGEELAPRIDGRDWVFDVPDDFDDPPEGGAWKLVLLELTNFGLTELELRRDRAGGLRAERAAELVASLARGGDFVAWSLDYRVQGKTAYRASGRRVGREGTLEE
jgi:hypothetical protein